MKLHLKTPQPSDILDKVFASVAIDRVARRVTLQPEDLPEPPAPKADPVQYYDWSLAPPLAGRALLAALFDRLDFSAPRIRAFFGAYGLAPAGDAMGEAAP